MKLRNRLTLTTGLLLTSGIALGHPGHEAIGNLLHLEYILAVGAAMSVIVFGLRKLSLGLKENIENSMGPRRTGGADLPLQPFRKSD